MEQKSIIYNGQDLKYLVSGSGPTLVLIHGFGETGTVWQEQLKALKSFRLIIPDLPGSGGSDIQQDMSMEGMAKSVRTILDTENVSKAVLVGHSMGGYVTLAFADLYPGRINGIGMFHSTAYADSAERIAIRRKGIDFIQRNGTQAFLKTTLPNYFTEETKKGKPELVERQLKNASGFTEAALVAYYESMIKRPDRTEVIRNSKVPVLYILGRHDTAVPLADGLEQAHLADLSFVSILTDSGHMGMMEEYEKANSILTEYLMNTNATT